MLTVFLRDVGKNIQFYRLPRKIIERQFFNDASNEHNIKKIKQIKRLASTILFGGTFLAVLWSRKKRKSAAFEDSKLVITENYHKNFKLYEYKGFVLPSFVIKCINNIMNFKCKDSDIFVVSFPKTGTTWLQEIIYCILYGTVYSSNENLEDRFPYLEFVYPGLAAIEKEQGQRLIKTHLPYSMLPEEANLRNSKIFYIMRSPKDVVVSYYHFVRMMTISDYKGEFEEFLSDFLADKVPYGPLWKHYSDIWEHKDDPNVLILFYEDLHKSPHDSVRRIATFLNRALTDQEVDDIVEHCKFENMSSNPNVNYQHWDDLGIRKTKEAKFMRKGEIGDWKNYFNVDTKTLMDRWQEDKCIAAYFPDEDK